MADIVALLATGLLLGLSGGLSPGPVTTLVITQTLRHGFLEGTKIAIAPLLTDLPVILGALLLFSRVSDIDVVLGVIAIVGALYLFYLAVLTFRAGPIDAETPVEAPRSIRIGLVANLLNPNPYLFWTLVGAPTLYRAIEVGVGAAIAFLLTFYGGLVGGKVAFAVLAAKGRAYLTGRAHHLTLQGLGLALGAFGLVFLWNGLAYLGVR